MTILEDHFDPEKKPKLAVSPDKNKVKTRNAKIADDKENNNNNKCDSGTESLDTTTSSPIKTKSEASENGAIVAEE